MSDSKFLGITKAIAFHLSDALKDSSDAALALTVEQMTFSAPKAARNQGKLSIFPYLFAPNQTSRNMLNPTEPSLKPAGQAFSVHYLITPSTGSAEKDLILLEKIILSFQTRPVLTREETNIGNSVSIVQETLSLADLTNLWLALEEPLKPCLSYSVSPIFLGSGDSAALQTTAPLIRPHVTELYQAVLKTFTGQVDDWKHRNMFQKQYVMMDFGKNTDMTPEEMLSKLKDLGHALETNQDIEPCIDFLKRLEAYYEHQKEMLKGFEKIQKKRQEGIDMVAKWKNEVTTLIEALCAK